MTRIYSDSERTVDWTGDRVYRITVPGKPAKTLDGSRQIADLSHAPPVIAEAVRKSGRTDYVWYGTPSLAMPRRVAEAIRNHYVSVVIPAQAAADAAERAALEAVLPGLSQLEAAEDDRERYSREFERMMEDENNDGANPPVPPAADLGELRRQYPAAAAYLRCQAIADGSHWASGRGPIYARAAERIAAGEPYATVLAEAEAEWSATAAAAVDRS